MVVIAQGVERERNDRGEAVSTEGNWLEIVAKLLHLDDTTAQNSFVMAHSWWLDHSTMY